MVAEVVTEPTTIKLHRAWRYRIYPTPEQEMRLRAWQDTLRFLWNLLVEQRRMVEKRSPTDRVRPTLFTTQFDLTALRSEFEWVEDVPRSLAQGVLVDHDLAWQRVAKRLAMWPRFKRAGRDWAPMRFTAGAKVSDGARDGARDGAIQFPKIGSVRATIHRPCEGRVLQIAVALDVDEWYACVAVEIDAAIPHVPSGGPVAINRGVVNLVGDSDGRTITQPHFYERAMRKLAHEQRRVERMQRGSKNEAKQREKIAKLHRTIARQRASFAHEITTGYARAHTAVILEDYAIAAGPRGVTHATMVGSETPRTLNRGILDAAWAQFASQLEYKCKATGAVFAKVDHAYISQTCPACSCIDEANHPSAEVFRCIGCGYEAHADVVAARHLLARWTPGSDACGGRSRPAKQELRTVRRATHKRGTDAP